MSHERIPEILKGRRKELKLSYGQLAAITGLSVHYLCKLEKNKLSTNLQLETITKIAHGLRLTVSQLTGETEI